MKFVLTTLLDKHGNKGKVVINFGLVDSISKQDGKVIASLHRPESAMNNLFVQALDRSNDAFIILDPPYEVLKREILTEEFGFREFYCLSSKDKEFHASLINLEHIEAVAEDGENTKLVDQSGNGKFVVRGRVEDVMKFFI